MCVYLSNNCGGRSVFDVVQQPFLDGARVEHRLGSGEGLADDNNESDLGIQSFERPGDVHGINIGQKLERPPAKKECYYPFKEGRIGKWESLLSGFGALGVSSKSFEDEFRPEKRSSNADAYNGGKRLPSGPSPISRTHARSEVINLINDCMYSWNLCIA